MKLKLISMMTVAFSALMLTGMFAGSAAAQKPKTVTLKSTTSTTRGADTNIKQEATANDPKVMRDPPAAKGGKGRGAGGCRVQLDNSTTWIISIYVDGVYRGAMDGWDDSYVYVAPGLTTVYARADFTDGSYKYWGPRDYNCGSGGVIDFKMVP